jgi:signal transduction histidine kinase
LRRFVNCFLSIMIFEHVEKCVFYSINKLHIQTKTDENNPMVHLRKLAPFIAFLIFGGISVMLWQNQNRHERELVLRHTETSAEQIRIRIEGLMNARMASIELMAERWVDRIPPDFSQKRFLDFAEKFYSHHPGFMGINWVDPMGVVRWVFPKNSNERVVDKPIFKHQEFLGNKKFHILHTDKNVITPCMELTQGGIGYNTFLPLVHSGRIQGYLNGVFQVKKIMDICLAKDIFEDFWVRLYESDQLIYTNKQQSDVNPEKNEFRVLRKIQFPGKTWKLDLVPKVLVYPSGMVRRVSILIFGLVVSVILSLLLYLLLERMQMYRLARDQALQEISERKRAELRIQHLSQQLLKAQETERQMISCELHDRVAQDLSASKIECDMLLKNPGKVDVPAKVKLHEISSRLQEAINAIRDLSYDLQPPILSEMGLLKALEIYCEEFSRQFGIKVEFQSAGLNLFELDPDTEIHIYRLVQEGLNNIRKHAGSEKAVVRLLGAFPNIILRIEDTGKGFDVKARELALSDEKRMGLRSMKERINLLGGQMTIQSRLMQGTKIYIKIPCQEQNRETEEAHIDH